ncbi:MAG TPA: hypothetical protein PLN19_04720 [Methanothrix sp.]|jgi:hypothetical protein|nr:hypothetical protein [Methanothrix sp.]HPC89796.1 hypothetical protein [Methanothrix sp.]HQE87561.1 hypothetical protein [Methanothrix sp.]HQI68128.1 hypothetical protein [Methanothrix sp.]HRS85113.1 hypothetical protein [Methanothrix sp.]
MTAGNSNCSAYLARLGRGQVVASYGAVCTEVRERLERCLKGEGAAIKRS